MPDMPDEAIPQSAIILYQTEDGRTRIQCRFEDQTIWLTQKLIADLFQVSVKTVNEHLINICDEGELAPEAVIRKFRITAAEGKTCDTQRHDIEATLGVENVGAVRGDWQGEEVAREVESWIPTIQIARWL